MKLCNILQKKAKFKAFFTNYDITHKKAYFKSVQIDGLNIDTLFTKEGESFWMDKLVLDEDVKGIFELIRQDSIVIFDADIDIVLKNIDFHFKRQKGMALLTNYR